MCNNTFNIKVVEGNAFPLIVRLQTLSYEAIPPIAEPIDYTRLTDCVLKVSNVEYDVEITEDGVRAIMPATLALGDYNVVFTAKYEGSDIRAAYLRAITIVKWNEQSNAGECLLGSPVVLPAAIVIGGTLTDAELEELKQETREKNAQLAQAIEDAEAAKAEWERKAAELDDVAQQTTLMQGVENIREDIAGINTSDLAKQGANPNATNTAILTAIGNIQDINGKQAIVSELHGKGIDVTIDDTLYEISRKIANDYIIPKNNSEFATTPTDIVQALEVATKIYTESSVALFIKSSNIIQYEAPYATDLALSFVADYYCPIKILRLPSVTGRIGNGYLSYMPDLEELDICSCNDFYYTGMSASSNTKLIKLVIGAGFNSNFSLNSGAVMVWNPSEALRTDTNSLVYEGEQFTSNREKLLYNIRTYIAANLQQLSTEGYSITFHPNVKAAILADQETADAFTNKGWTIA